MKNIKLIYRNSLLTLPVSLLVLLLTVQNVYSQTIKTVGASGADYTTLKAAFDAINAGTVTGTISLQIIASTTETASAVLNASGTGSCNYSSITIYPAISGISVDGTIAGPLIDLNGADNVTINGTLNNGTNKNKDITFSNQSTSSNAGTSVFRFINGAISNSIKNCYIKGGSTDAAGGLLFFSTSTGPTGNSSNLITANNIMSYADANRPLNVFYSVGSASYPNISNNMNGNSIHNFFNTSNASNGIFLGDNNSSWIIQGNNFYESISLSCTGTQAYHVIYINNSGTNYTINKNQIGGKTASNTGIWTKTGGDNNFTGIYLSVGTAVASNIQQDSLINFSWSNTSSAGWTAINVASGTVNIGTTTGNYIGVSTGTGSITLTGGATGAAFYGINIASTGTVNCQNNFIGAITTSNSSVNATNFFGINKTATAGTTTISNNTIGSSSTSSSINASSQSTAQPQVVQAISSAGTGSVTISGNTIANLVNGTSNTTAGTAGLINGISVSGGTNTIANNSIHDLAISNANSASTDQASAVGIVFNSASAAAQSISGNSIYNLSNTYTSFPGSVTGIYYYGSATASAVSKNFIRSLSVTGTSSTAATLCGIKINEGICDFVNNVVTLGENITVGCSIKGMDGNMRGNLYFNTIKILGTVTGTASNTQALNCNSTTDARSFKNNLFLNQRSGGSGGNNYAIYLNNLTSLTIDYNNYYTGGSLLGYCSGDKSNLSEWKAATGQDVNSVSDQVYFVSTTDLHVTGVSLNNTTLGGTPISGITTDKEGTTRNATSPTMGAYEHFLVSAAPTATQTIFLSTSGTQLTVTEKGGASVSGRQWGKRSVPGGTVTAISGATGSTYTPSGSGLGLGTWYLVCTSTPAVGSALISNEVQVSVYAGLTWTGTSGNDWNVAGNWTPNFVPDITLDATIPAVATLPVVYENPATPAKCNNLTINTGGMVSIESGKALTVGGTLSNSGSILIKSTASGIGSLINSTAGVNATVQRYLNNTDWTNWKDGWHFLSSPVASQAISPNFTSDPYDFYCWYEPLDLWVNYKNQSGGSGTEPYFDVINGSLNFSVGKGYLAAYDGEDVKSFSGTLNIADVAVSGLTITGNTQTHRSWHLLGNPYASAILWDGSSAWGMTNIAGTAKIWNEANQSYSDLTSVPLSSDIPPTHGFMVQVSSGIGSLTIPASKRVHTAQGLYKSIIPFVKLVARNTSYGNAQESNIFFYPDATAGFDLMYDGEFRAGYGPLFYSVAGNEHLSTNTLPAVDANLQIPFDFIKNEGTAFSIELKSISGINGAVILHDLKTGSEQDLTLNPVYTFTAESGDNASRFLITFRSLGINETVAGNSITIHSKGNRIYISDRTGQCQGEVFVYNLMGQLMKQQPLTGNGATEIRLNATTGYYLVKVVTPRQINSAKIFIFDPLQTMGGE